MNRWLAVVVWLSMFVLLLVLAGCGQTTQSPSESNQNTMGLLEVTISGIGQGNSATASAEWLRSGELSSQTVNVVPVNGTNTLNDVQFITRAVSVYDSDRTATRYVLATFDLINRTTTNFANFTLYAVNKSGVSIGGTGITSITSGTGVAITDSAIARRFKPTHGMMPAVQGLAVNANVADLQFFTPTEVDNPTNGIKQQAIAQGILTAADTVLEYGFVARNYTGGRGIAARNTVSNCTGTACKGTVTLAYKLPKGISRENNPFSFGLNFIVANDTTTIGAQSIEEQTFNTVMGRTSFPGFTQVRTLAGSKFQGDALVPLCRVRTAISPNLYLGPDPIPNASGSFDICFGVSGERIFDTGQRFDKFPSMAIQSDGKIVVIGWGEGTPKYMIRYNPNGSLDTGFGTGGKVILPSGFFANGLAIQSDGKIVVAGTALAKFGGGSLDISMDFALTRYNSNGSLDTSFGAGGLVTTLISTQYDEATALALQTDGKIVVVGFTDADPNTSIKNYDFALARYNSNGSLDTTFSSDGKTTLPIGTGNEQAYGVAIAQNGRILVAGYSHNGSNSDFAMARFERDGALSIFFGGGGVVKTAFHLAPSGDSVAESITFQSDGKILLAGYTYGSVFATTTDFAMARYSANGVLDTTFGTGGKVTTDFASDTDVAYGVAVQSDGKIVLAGFAGGDIALARYNPSGSLDTTFDADGKVTTGFDSSIDKAMSLALQSDGKVVVAGHIGDNAALVRYNP